MAVLIFNAFVLHYISYKFKYSKRLHIFWAHLRAIFYLFRSKLQFEVLSVVMKYFWVFPHTMNVRIFFAIASKSLLKPCKFYISISILCFKMDSPLFDCSRVFKLLIFYSYGFEIFDMRNMWMMQCYHIFCIADRCILKLYHCWTSQCKWFF